MASEPQGARQQDDDIEEKSPNGRYLRVRARRPHLCATMRALCWSALAVLCAAGAPLQQRSPLLSACMAGDVVALTHIHMLDELMADTVTVFS